MLAFGWLFMSPAAGDDPLTVAAKQIENLNSAVDKLDYKEGLIDLIDIAENKFMYAKNLKDVRDTAIVDYQDAVEAEELALEEVNIAQSNVDEQTALASLALENKNNALNDKNDAQDVLDLANINLQTAQSNMQSASGTGLQYTVYNLTRTWPSIATPSGVICSGTWNSSSMNLPVCGNRYENIIVKFTGQITVPSWFTTVAFAGYTDDGFRMFINGNLAVNNWVEQGARWSAWSPTYNVSEDKTLDVEIWWYNGGGPGSYHLGWTIPGGMTGAGCDYSGSPRVWGQNFSCNLNTFSSGSGPTQEQLNAYGIDVYYNPEFIAQGSIIKDLQYADMVLIGGEGRHLDVIKEIYTKIQLIEPKVHTMSTTAAELVKLAVNCFLTTKITYANMVGEVMALSGRECEISKVLKAIGDDTRVGSKYLKFGYGYGGPCLPRDNRAFAAHAKKLGLEYNLGLTTDSFNQEHSKFVVDWFVNKNEQNLPFCFHYVSYKEDTDIIEESQQYRLCCDLLNLGYKVYVVDNLVKSKCDERIVWGIPCEEVFWIDL